MLQDSLAERLNLPQQRHMRSNLQFNQLEVLVNAPGGLFLSHGIAALLHRSTFTCGNQGVLVAWPPLWFAIEASMLLGGIRGHWTRGTWLLNVLASALAQLHVDPTHILQPSWGGTNPVSGSISAHSGIPLSPLGPGRLGSTL